MKNNRPLVSIIVPTYNVEKYARECFESLVRQTLKNIEIILIDDGSKDSSGKICDEYALKDSRVKVIHQTNRGLGLTRNVGMKVATGEYVGFVDSDDIVSVDMFKILYNNAKINNADISYCRFKRFVKSEELMNKEKYKEILDIFNDKKCLKKYYLDRIGMPPNKKADVYCSASVCCGIFKNDLLNKTKVNFVSERKWISEDMVFDLCFIPYCTCIVHSNLELYFYRGNITSLTKIYNENRFKKNVELYHHMEDIIKINFSREEYINHLNRYYLTFLRVAIIQEVAFLKQNGYKYVKNKINAFLNLPETDIVLKEYPIAQMTFRYKMFFYLLRYRFVRLVLFILAKKYCL